MEEDSQLEIWCGNGGWFTKDGRGTYGVGLWKEIKKEEVVPKHFSSFDVGDGRRTRL